MIVSFPPYLKYKTVKYYQQQVVAQPQYAYAAAPVVAKSVATPVYQQAYAQPAIAKVAQPSLLGVQYSAGMLNSKLHFQDQDVKSFIGNF